MQENSSVQGKTIPEPIQILDELSLNLTLSMNFGFEAVGVPTEANQWFALL